MNGCNSFRVFPEREVGKGRLGGAVLLATRDGSPFIAVHVGDRDREAEVFRTYSRTKPVASVAALTLIEQGRLQLDDPVAAFLPELESDATLDAPHRPCEIRILDLLRHTAGYTYGFFDDTPVDRMYADADLLDPRHTLENLVKKLSRLPLKYPPGTVWEYGVSTDVLARVVEVVSGSPFDRFCRERVLSPLDMRDTDYGVPQSERHRIAVMYETDDAGRCIRSPLRNPPDVGAAPVLRSGNGGLWSTARDYSRFARMLLEGGSLDGVRVLDPETVRLMTRDHLGALPRNSPVPGLLDGCGFGLGVAVRNAAMPPPRRGSVGEYFWLGAGGPYFWVDPRERLACVLMLQHWMPMSIFEKAREFVYEWIRP
jgi:CubicO group peptidase (beta-lactamase class C family)